MINRIIPFFILIILVLISPLSVQGALPPEYIANHQTADIWSDILDIFVQIQARKRTGEAIPPGMFAKLSQDFEQMFPYLPQRPEFKIVYEQCRITTSTLSRVYKLSDFTTFYNQCHTPLNGIIGQINSKYTVSANAGANPTRDNVPFTVTLDGRGSTDPTRETIPETNYYRSMRDIDGVEKTLGIGPIINYTFTKPGDYIINFVVRSPHKSDHGIFDGQQKITIKAEPQIANISVYLGFKKLDPDEIFKISTTEVQQGIVLDGSSTSPRGGRIIVGHRRDIFASSDTRASNQNIYTKISQGAPAAIKTTLPSHGRYTVRLSITDNQGANTYQNYKLAVSDPVAIIKTNPKSGTTSTRFTIDAGASYSVVSKIKSYTRELYDQQGQKLDTLTDKSFNRQFLIPGLYTIKLVVTDMDGKTTQEQIQLAVDSTAPDAQFSITPSTKLIKPSEFTLDASHSDDIDSANGDKLTYSRSLLADPQVGKIVVDPQDPAQALVTFEKKGSYKIKLIVKDQYNKSDEIIKIIDVESALRPQVQADPVSASRNTPVSFSVSANKPVKFYHYDFGDGTKLVDHHQATVTHTYKKTGIYKVKVKIISADDEIEENTITTNVFVTNKDEPSLGYKIIKADRFNTVFSTSGSCQGNEAYQISRYQAITIDTTDSVNIQGKKDNLSIIFMPQNAEPILRRKSLSNYKFDELGCQYIDVMIEDTNVMKSAQTRIWFDVQNTPPRIGNLKMTFPQYGNEIGIGFSQGRFRDIFSTTNIYDPLIVKVIGNNIKDPDGYIKYLTWYYYRTDDPDRRLVLKTTPPSSNFVYFSLPRIAGEYSFGVEAIDNDGAKVSSQETIGDGPIVFFPPEKNDADIPYVTFKVDQNNIKVGEEVNFEVISRVVSNKQDFESSKTIRYDFDGDGEYDLTTKDASIRYIYEKPGVYKPKVKVTYRGKSNRVAASTEDINVEQGLKTDFLYTSVNKTVILRNTSIGQIKGLTWCMDMTKCPTDNSYVVEESDYHSFTYPDYGKYVVKLEARDEYGNSQTERKIISVSPLATTTTTTTLVTIPEGKHKGNNIEITIGKQLKHTVTFYINYPGTGQCFVDSNILIDSNYNGKQDDDKDILCNQLKSATIQSTTPDVIARLYYEELGSGKQTKDILINMIDTKPLIMDKYKDTYNQLDNLIKKIDVNDEQTSYLKTLLLQLKNNLGDKTDTASLILQIKDLIENPDLKVNDADKDLIQKIIIGLSDAPIIAAQGGNDYDSYKANIKLLLKGVSDNFTAIDQADGDQKVIKMQLDEIYKIAQLKTKSSDVDSIDLADFEEIKNNLCNIAQYYQVSTKTCGNPESDMRATTGSIAEDTNVSSKASGTVWSKILKFILVVLGVVALVFLGLIVIFAIKAKREQKANEGEEDGE